MTYHALYSQRAEAIRCQRTRMVIATVQSEPKAIWQATQDREAMAKSVARHHAQWPRRPSLHQQEAKPVTGHHARQPRHPYPHRREAKQVAETAHDDDGEPGADDSLEEDQHQQETAHDDDGKPGADDSLEEDQHHQEAAHDEEPGADDSLEEDHHQQEAAHDEEHGADDSLDEDQPGERSEANHGARYVGETYAH